MTDTPKGWTIVYNPKPIPDRRFDWDYSHENYDGENGLCGNAASFDDAVFEINGIETDEYSEEELEQYNGML